VELLVQNIKKKDLLKKNKIFDIIDRAGMQRILFQRIILYTLGEYFEIGEKDCVQIENTKKKFSENIQQLIAYRKNTEILLSELINLRDKWEQLEDIVEQLLDDDSSSNFGMVREMMLLSEQILLSFNEIVFLYKQISDEYLENLGR
jgi:hypothetical protein